MFLAGKTGICVKEKLRKGIGWCVCVWGGGHTRQRLNAVHLLQKGVERAKRKEGRAGQGRAAERGRGRQTLTPKHLRWMRRGERRLSMGRSLWGAAYLLELSAGSHADRASAESPLQLRGMNSQNMSPRLWVCAVLAVYHGAQTCTGFNIDERFPVIKEGKTKGSFFGFSVALHQQTEGSRKYL